MSRRARGIGVAAIAVALLLLYVWAVAWRGWALVTSGRAVGVALGLAVLIIPLLVVWFVVREVGQAMAVDALTKRLADEGGLHEDDLPRSPGGRIDRSVAAEQFPAARDAVAAEPDSWRAWFHLGWAYDAAGDRRHARESLRRAVRLERAERAGRRG